MGTLSWLRETLLDMFGLYNVPLFSNADIAACTLVSGISSVLVMRENQKEVVGEGAAHVVFVQRVFVQLKVKTEGIKEQRPHLQRCLICGISVSVYCLTPCPGFQLG